MGGEKKPARSLSSPMRGSPPHRRGKVLGVELHAPANGITPAQAGKSTCRASMPTVSWDHPRTGGEKAELTVAVISSMGSPPRRRGKDFMFCGQHLEIRITPAWAGKSAKRHCTGSLWGDHPRVGGEKSESWRKLAYGPGSPPHRRRKEDQKAAGQRFNGITPAQAGKRARAWTATPRNRDHPRAGGEKIRQSIWYRTT